MLRGNPPPNIPFFLFFSISFPSLFKKKSENFGGGGGFEPPEPPPLKYALGHWYFTQIKTHLSATYIAYHL